MKTSLLNSVGAVGAAIFSLCPAQAWADEAADAANERGPEIVVLGKSYGEEVGKTVTPLKDIPNTVTLVDREQIQAQNLFTLEDALTATPGITVTGVGSEDPSYMSRGFAISNYLIDGTPTLSFGFPSVVPDLFAYDRLEVLRGPAGLFSGSGNPAGSINLVRKRPLDELKLQGSLGYGSYQNFRGEIDVSAPLAKGVAVRAGAMVQDQDQFFDVAHRNRVTAFGVGKIDIGERTTFTFGATYDRFKPAIQSGLPGLIGGADGSDGQLLDIRRSTYLGADWNRFKSDIWSAFADITHEISDRWTIRASALYTDVERVDVYSYIGNQPITETNGLTNHIAYRGDSFMKSHSFDFNAVGSFPAFGREQTLILGFDYQDSSYQSYGTRLSNYARIDVYNPVSPLEPPLDPYKPSPPYTVQGGTGQTVTQNLSASDTRIAQFGAYGQMRFSPVEGLTAIGGGRLTWWDTDTQTLLPTLGRKGGYSIDARFTPYAGLVWDATREWNIYASYADSFTPQAAPAGRTRPDGQQVEPLVGAQYELGTKLSLMNDRLLLSAAAYQIEQTNRLFNDPDDAGVVLQIGKVRARGFEAEAAGEILPGWRINGGYSYTRTKYLEDANASFEGLPLVPIIPKHSVKVFTNYKAPAGALAGLSLGGGLTWFSSTYGGNPATFNAAGALVTRSSIVRQGAYAVVDLRAGYEFDERISLSVNVNNVLDKTYYARISSTGRGNYFGTPRTVFATLRFAYP
ncbi:outer membrane receptor for ferric coprogen and ferric-rhodotorulic acid [Novosphingobium sp. PhB55]|uniref:TonB-dependent siderophore receptor n=1 Tax=Novosphingobium sp. PhB55 TaxID=2485106 RepID=UPI0010649AF5|nr:TonB-dependent siderophore receptor [Novosphingobium sp. PhB55]TDW63442.1 outer membrane receptor for ferric coprogen and ferric-rhodotorulic acid [Novosphingobium sp. PhB55]